MPPAEGISGREFADGAASGVRYDSPRHQLVLPLTAKVPEYGWVRKVGSTISGVTALERKRELFDSIVRLRRAGRAATDGRDIAAVRARLESELGETVSQRFAASVLSVSHTALARWMRSGDLPAVYTGKGRMEIPVDALVDLHEAVTRERMAGRRSRHVLEPSMSEARRRARLLDTDHLIDGADAGGDSHGRAELRSLAYHRALASRLTDVMVKDASQTLWRWRELGRIDPRYAGEWQELLTRPLSEIRRVIGADSPRGHDLRQNSPFAGMLSEAERRRILQDIR